MRQFVLHVPVEVVINYRYNEYALNYGFAKGVRPITLPVNLSVVWEGGKHGAAKDLRELVKAGIISAEDAKQFPKEFMDEELIKKGDKSIMLAMVPPQEVQIMVFAPTWEKSRDIGIKLTGIYQKLLKEYGIDIDFGAESAATTKQIKTRKTEKTGNEEKLITLELILDILKEATYSKEMGEDAKFVRWALDLASSEMYIAELDMYYIGPSAAGNETGLVTNEQFTEYKMKLFQKYPFTSCEDWADEGEFEHWEDGKQIMKSMVNIGDDNLVSRADLIAKYTVDPNIKSIDEIVDRILELHEKSRYFDAQERKVNAHLQKPNQSGEELAMLYAVLTSHLLNNLVIFSHRGTRPSTEKYTSYGAIGTGAFGIKCTLYGKGRGALILVINDADRSFNKVFGMLSGKKVGAAYQGALFLNPDTNSPYYKHPVAIELRKKIPLTEQELEEIAIQVGQPKKKITQFLSIGIFSPIIYYLMQLTDGQRLAEKISTVDLSAILPAVIEKLSAVDSSTLLAFVFIPLVLRAVYVDQTGLDKKRLFDLRWLETHRAKSVEKEIKYFSIAQSAKSL